MCACIWCFRVTPELPAGAVPSHWHALLVWRCAQAYCSFNAGLHNSRCAAAAAHSPCTPPTHTVLVSMSIALQQHGVIDVFTGWAGSHLAPLDLPWPALFGALHLVFFAMHYLFASQVAHVGALYTAFLSLMLAGGECACFVCSSSLANFPRFPRRASQAGCYDAGLQHLPASSMPTLHPSNPHTYTYTRPHSSGVPPKLAAMTLAYNICLQGGMTHYASSQAAAYYGTGA